MSDALLLHERWPSGYRRRCFFVLVALLLLALAPVARAQPRVGGRPAPPAAGRPQLELQVGHTGIVWAVGFSADGRTLVSAGADGVRVWGMPAGLLQRTQTIQGTVAMALSSDGELLARGTRAVVTLWDTGTGAPVRTLAGAGDPVLSLVFSPDRKRLAGAGRDGKVTVWDVGTGAVLQRLPGASLLRSLCFAPDGKALACGGDGVVTLWDLRTGTVERTLALPTPSAPVTALDFSPDGKTLAGGAGNGPAPAELFLWDARSGALRRTLAEHARVVRSITFSRDGRLLASAAAPNGGVEIWDWESGTQRQTLIGSGSSSGPVSVAFTPDGRLIAVGTNGSTIQLWNARTGILQVTLGRSEPVLAVAVSPDGRQIASGGTDGAIRLWDARAGSLERALTGATGPVHALLYSPDGTVLASRSEDGRVTLWDAAAGTPRRTLTGVRWAAPLVFAAGGELLASGAGSAVILWDYRTGRPNRVLRGHTGLVRCLAGDRDGTTLASGSADGTVRLWEARSGRLLRTFPGAMGPLFAVALSPDGGTLASSDRGGEIRLWNAQTGALLRTIPTRAVTLSLTFSPDGSTLASIGPPLMVRLWDVRTGAPQSYLIGHTHQVSSLAFFPDGQRIVSAGWDQTVRIWRADNGRLLTTTVILPPADGDEVSTDWLTVTPAGYYDGSPGAGRFIQWQVGSDRFPVEAYEPILHRPAFLRRVLSGAALAPSPPLQRFDAGQALPPRVEFTGIRDGQRVTGDTVPVELAVTGDRPVSRWDLLVNGRPQNAKPIAVGAKAIAVGAKAIAVGAKALPAAQRTLQQFHVEVPLPAGESELTLKAIAYDAEGLQGWAVVRLTRTPGAAVVGDLYVLAVGISQYQNPKYDLKYAAADAQAFSGLWQRMQGTLYRRVIVTTLADAQATAASIRAALSHLSQQVTRNDTLVLFLSGHGIQVEEGQFYFAPHDVDAGTPDEVARTALPWTVFQTLLANVAAKRVFLFLDACHAGSALGEQQASNERLAEAMARHGGVLVFSSSRGSEYSYEDDALRHGAFTAALLEGIGQGKADLEIAGRRSGTITAEELLAYLRARVPQLTMNRQTPSCPLIYDFGEAFLLASAP